MKKNKTKNNPSSNKETSIPIKIYPEIFELIIIESLKKEEKQTGEILHDETIKYKKFQEAVLSSSLIKVKSKLEFIESLRNICKRIENDKLYPILHIETHGSLNGFHLSNGEEISWEELFEETRKINLLLKNSLMINLSMCYGISMIAKINPDERAPFRAIVGTARPISWQLLLQSFEIFYNNYFFSFSVEDSIELVNKNIGDKDLNFSYIKSEYLFERFTNFDTDPEFFKSLINEYAVKEKASNPEFKKTEFKDVLNYTRQKMEIIFGKTRNNRAYFLMEDVNGIFG